MAAWWTICLPCWSRQPETHCSSIPGNQTTKQAECYLLKRNQPSQLLRLTEKSVRWVPCDIRPFTSSSLTFTCFSRHTMCHVTNDARFNVAICGYGACKTIEKAVVHTSYRLKRLSCKFDVFSHGTWREIYKEHLEICEQSQQFTDIAYGWRYRVLTRWRCEK